MGLAAPKNRMKLSHDPNNTKWTSDTQSFGHKMMAAQGWKPGEYLGAKDAPHAEFHTVANASHIRVMIKDDNLGLGAKVGSGVGHGECTGLDAFKNLLGRLNGQDEDELEKEQKNREELKRAIYTEQRWGSIRFVQGGFLVGDKIQHLIDEEAERLRKLAVGSVSDSSDSSDSDSDSEPEPLVEKTKKSKLRKLEQQEDAPAEVVSKVKKSKKRKLEDTEDMPEVFAVKIKKSKKKRKSEASPEDSSEVTTSKENSKSSKKKSKRKRDAEPELDSEGAIADTKTRKKDRKDKKKKTGQAEELTKESRKESKRDNKKKMRDPEVQSESTEASQPATKEHTSSTPLDTNSGRSTPIMMQGRHAVRARNIAQKRLASMDVASLNQIFMIKS